MTDLCLIGFYEDVQPYTSDGEDKTFRGSYVKKGQIVVLRHLSVVDVSKEERELRIGIQRGDESEHWINKRIAPSNSGVWGLFLNGQITLRENERPVAQIINPDSEDECYFSAFGLVYKAEE